MFPSMWDLPGPGLEPVSPALAGRFLTIVPPGKPSSLLNCNIFSDHSLGFTRKISVLYLYLLYTSWLIVSARIS